MLSLLPSPARLPALSLILDDIGRPAPRVLAAALGVPDYQVRRWLKADQAPRAAMLALFWITKWGRSELDGRLAYEAALHVALSRSLRDELRASRAALRRVLSLANFDSANSPLFELSAPELPERGANQEAEQHERYARPNDAPDARILAPLTVDSTKSRIRVDRA